MIPEFNPQPDDQAEFPIEHPIEYCAGVRLERGLVWMGKQRQLRWICPHGEHANTPEVAAALCITNCKTEGT